jgi:hypothetical protein
MSRRTVVSLLAATTMAALPASPSASASASACPDPADNEYLVPYDFPYPETHGRPLDLLAISPGSASFRIAHSVSCNATPTIARPNGNVAHQVPLLYDGTVTGIAIGTETLDYASGTGPWRITKATANGSTVDLTDPVDYVVRRASTVTLAVTPASAPARPVASGVVKYWTFEGLTAPSPGRTVVIRKPDRMLSPTSWVAGDALATTKTDAQGRYSVSLPIGVTQYVIADVPATTTLGYVFTPFAAPVKAVVYQPTSLTGRAAPTTATVVRPGTKMSTYGHLSVVYTTGRTGPFAKQTVLIQTRPRANPAAGYSTVASAVTTSTGYYYANWTARYDADVRVAYVSPYQYIRSSYRWLALLDVR